MAREFFRLNFQPPSSSARVMHSLQWHQEDAKISLESLVVNKEIVSYSSEISFSFPIYLVLQELSPMAPIYSSPLNVCLSPFLIVRTKLTLLPSPWDIEIIQMSDFMQCETLTSVVNVLSVAGFQVFNALQNCSEAGQSSARKV